MSHYYTTPLHGSQTPSYAAFGSRTPMVGNQTPMHDGPSTFATLNLTTPSYSHLTDALASGLGSSSSNNSSST